MKLPNAAHAIVEIEKLRDYCLSASHPRGRHKARVFSTALGITAEDAEELRNAILSAVLTEEAASTERDEYGQRYTLDFTMTRQDKTDRLIFAQRGSSVFEKIIHGLQVVTFYRS